MPAETYGLPGKGYGVEGEAVRCAPFLELRWRPKDGEWQEVKTQLIGAYNATNALAAAAVGLHFGVTPEQITHALSHYCPTNNRSELKRTERNTLVVDAYNANPTSMQAALDNFALMEGSAKLAILGEMRELGDASAEEHAKVAQQACALTGTEVWFVGQNFAPFAPDAPHFADAAAVKAHLQQHPQAGRLILIKGSNGTRLFELPEWL